MDKKEFKVGQVWQQRDGVAVHITEVDVSQTYAVVSVSDSDYKTWTLSGNYLSDGSECQEDLVELVQDVATPCHVAAAEGFAAMGCEPELVTHTTTAAGAAPIIPDWVKTSEEAAAEATPEPYIPNTEIARTIAQFIDSKRINLRSWGEERERTQRLLDEAVNRETNLRYELEQAKRALAALK